MSAYLDVLLWCVKEGFRPVPGTVIAMLGGNLAAVALQVNAVAITLMFGRALSTGSTISLPGFEGDPRESTTTVVIAGLGVFLSMLGNAGARYASRLAELRLRERFASSCWGMSLTRIAAGTVGNVGELAPDSSALQRIVRSDAILCSRFAALLILTLLAAAKLSLAVATLLYIDPGLTSIILAVGAGFGFAIYALSLRSARFSVAFEDCTPAARDETKAILDRTAYSLTPAPSNSSITLELPARDRFLRLYSKRLRAADDSEAIGNLFLAMVLGTTVIGIGLWAAGDDQSWRHSATFIIALPYALITFRELARTGTSLNRFYPMVRRFRNFVRDIPVFEQPTDGPSRSLTISRRSAGGARGTGQPGMTLQAGDMLVVNTPHPVDRMTAGWLIASLAGTGSEAAFWSGRVAIASSRCPVDRASLKALGWGTTELEDLRRITLATERGHVIETHFPAEDPLPIPGTHIHSVPRFLMALVAASRSPAPGLIFADARSMQELPPAGLPAIRQLVRDHILVLVVARGPLTMELPAETPAAIVGARGDVRIGDVAWLKAEETGVSGATRTDTPDVDDDEDGIDDL